MSIKSLILSRSVRNVWKQPLGQVLKKGHQQEWETRMSLLKSLPQFKDYSTKELHQVNTRAKLVEYAKNTVSHTSHWFSQ